MNTIESITTDDLGRVVVYKSVVMRINHSWKNDIDRYREEGVLLLASNDKHMARLGDLISSYGQYRLLIQQSLKNLKRGLLLGKSTRMVGKIWYEDEVGGIFQPDGSLPVAIVMPLACDTRYRALEAIVEWEYKETEA